MLQRLVSSSLALLVSINVLAAAQDSSPQLLNPDFAELSERWRGAMADLGVPGLAVAVVEGDTLLHLETFGIRNSVTQAEVDPDTMFYIASATKPFVAMALLQCVDEGKLDLDLPVKKYLPRFQLADAAATESITTRDLLCHRPGINSGAIVFLDAYTGGITDDRYFHFLSSVQPRGTVAYTNVHFTLAGHVLQALDGKPWKESLRERIFEPLGMQRTTGYATWMYAQDNVAMPTVWGAQGFEHAAVRKTDETMHAAGGLGTSIHDSALWLQLNLGMGELHGQRLVSEASMEEMFAPQSELKRGNGVDGFGLGWMRGELHGELLLQHGGGYVGASTHYSFMPSTGLGVAILTNTDRAGRALVDTVREDVYGYMLVADTAFDPLPGRVEDARRSQESREVEESRGENPADSQRGLSLDPSRYAGVYRDTHWGDFELNWDGSQLGGRMGNVSVTLHTRGADRFLAYSPDRIEWEFIAEIEAGEVTSLTVDGETMLFDRVK